MNEREIYTLREKEARASQQARREIARLQDSLRKMSEKLASGERIHGCADSSPSWNNLMHTIGEVDAFRAVMALTRTPWLPDGERLRLSEGDPNE